MLSEARSVPLDLQFGRVRGWQWRQAGATRYRLLLREATDVLMYGGRREVFAANESTASARPLERGQPTGLSGAWGGIVAYHY